MGESGCSEYQRYTFMKAIHNSSGKSLLWECDVQNIKDIHLWKQFTTLSAFTMFHGKMFRISKIYIYESNSQHCSKCINRAKRCSEYQRYTFMKAIHNESVMALSWLLDVQNIKDIHLWKQFTTTRTNTYKCWQMFRISKIYIYESNSQHLWEHTE